MPPERERRVSTFQSIVLSCRSLSNYESKRFKTLIPQLVATLIALCLNILVGITYAYSAILVPQLQEAQNTTAADVIRVSSGELSWITSIIMLSSLVGALSAGFIMDIIGRLNMLKLMAIPSLLGWILLALAYNIPMLVSGRFFTGIALVWSANPTAVYITEISRPDVRGSFMGMRQLGVSLGMMMVYLKGWFLNWRTVAWMNVGYTIVFVGLTFLVPESPVWLVSKNRTAEAKKALEWIYKYQPPLTNKVAEKLNRSKVSKSLLPDDDLRRTQTQFLQKENLIKTKEREKLSANSSVQKMKMFLQPTGYKPFLIMIGLYLFQQVSGIHVIVFNGVIFFKEMGTSLDPYMAGSYVGVVRLVMNVINIYLTKRFNRRALMMASGIGMAVCMGTNGLYTHWIKTGVVGNNGWFSLILLMAYFVFAAMGFLTIPFSIQAEVFPLEIRSMAHAIVSTVVGARPTMKDTQNLEDRKHAQLLEILNSTRSISYYDSKTLKTLLPQIIVAAVLICPNIVVGIIYAYSAILVPQLMAEQNGTDPDALSVSKSESAWITSSAMLIMPVGAITGGIIMDALGRLNLLKLMVLPCVSGFILIATAKNVPMIIAGRMLTGIGLVWGLNPGTVYIAEVSRADVRGPLSASLLLSLSIGMVLVMIKGWFLHWRLVAWLSNIYMFIFILLVMFIPESPVWLVSKGRLEQAKKSLDWFNRYQPQLETKIVTYSEMQLSVLQREHVLKTKQEEQMTGSGFAKKLKMFVQPTGLKPLLILAGLFFFQQFSGVHLIIFNGVIFFQAMGITMDPYLASIIIGSVRLVMSVVYTWLMKRFNRRLLMIVSNIGMCISIGLSGLFTSWIQDGTSSNTWIPVTMLMIYFVFAAIGVMFIPILIASEVFPVAIRGISQSLVSAIAHLLMFTILQCYYPLDEAFGGSAGIQYFFAAMCIVGLIFTYLFMPETRNKKLSLIEEYFVNNTVYISKPTFEIGCTKIRKDEIESLHNTN
ncbi:hypothetical protein FQR65_LT00231 [Abscondita terminalis]|nr:hypothetical protein FQR65_LT00231 [Abscondita terminalis]